MQLKLSFIGEDGGYRPKKINIFQFIFRGNNSELCDYLKIFYYCEQKLLLIRNVNAFSSQILNIII